MKTTFGEYFLRASREKLWYSWEPRMHVSLATEPGKYCVRVSQAVLGLRAL